MDFFPQKRSHIDTQVIVLDSDGMNQVHFYKYCIEVQFCGMCAWEFLYIFVLH